MIYRLGNQAPKLSNDGVFVAPGAEIIGNVTLKAEASVWFNAVLRGDNDHIEIGARSNVQDGAILHTDPGLALMVGSGVTVGHRAMLHGCQIGNNSLIGIGSTILNGARIGADSLVGAHALVTENKTFPDGVLLLGSPAQVVRELTPEERAALRESAAIYVAQSRRYREQLQVQSPG